MLNRSRKRVTSLDLHVIRRRLERQAEHMTEAEAEAALIRDRQLQAVIDRIPQRDREGAMAEFLAQAD